MEAGSNSTLPGGTASHYHAPPETLSELVALAGVRFDGDHPWDIQVKNPRLYERVMRHGALGFGESYVDGDWDAGKLDELFVRFLSANLDRHIRGVTRLRFLLSLLKEMLINRQSRQRAFQVGEQHYDIGNDVYTAMLDPSMSYSCGYWEHADTLEEAQQAKLRMICEKLHLARGERLLDIGCGWGGLAHYAATHYGVEVQGITVSKKQQAFAQERCRDLPVTIALKDYRELDGSFDKVVSVGMFEHVGPKNYRRFFQTVFRVMQDDGLFLLHTIGAYANSPVTDPWIDRYIFPNGKIPSARQLTTAWESQLVLEDWHNFGQDYDRTLMAWWDNFREAWPSLKDKYGEPFYRMWKYYLLCSAGFFRSRQGQLWQIVLSKRGRHGVYRSIRPA
ncbi:MAG: cyclopropane fatty acyl phospholipid synthase [Pseudomonadota bacterium]